jgi:hypothetical protein
MPHRSLLSRDREGEGVVNYDTSKVDETVLGLLYLNLYGNAPATRAWKGLDWDAMDRLHKRGFISDPRSKAKSVAVSAEGVSACRAAFDRLFGAA